MEEAAGDGQRRAVVALGARMMPPLTDLTLEPGLLEAVQAILAQHPTLTASGFDDRKLPTKTNLLDYRGLCEVQGALDYLDAGRRKTVAKQTSVGSYTLKHQVEGWHRLHDREVYVSSGAMLIALMMRGYSLFRRRADDLNRGVGIHWIDVVTRLEREAMRDKRCSRPVGEPRKFGPVASALERGLPGQEAYVLRAAAK